MRRDDNDNAINLIPGVRSPLTWMSFLLGTGLLIFGDSTENHDRAIYMLAIAFTSLKTDNPLARGASVAGAALRMVSNGAWGAIGFLMQTGAALYALIPVEEERQAERLGEAEEARAARRN